ncbi:MAG TPA: quercetin 2,3-dioxygenase [Terracidiphilus sp.]|nr:quercetin 2,3-dioxygenase [Terracidiphilus sp.]
MTSQIVDIPVEISEGSASQDSASSVRLAPVGQIQHVPAGAGRAYWGPGTQMTFIATGKETGGAFFLAQMAVPPGGGPPPHIHHREDESFHVLEGTLTIQAGQDTITASAGDFAYLPRGIAHTFRNTGSMTAKVLVLITPAGLENYFAEVFEQVTDPDAPPPPPGKDLIARALAVSPRYGLELLPPA